MEPDQKKLTQLMNQWANGDQQAGDLFMSIIYNKLKKEAESVRRGHDPRTCRATDLLHTTLMGLRTIKSPWKSRFHFFHTASRMLRRKLIDDARKRNSLKRGGGQHDLPFEDGILIFNCPPDQLIIIDTAFERLRQHNPEIAEVFSQRYYWGYTTAETATNLGISISTVERHWKFAKNWLYLQITKGDG